MTSGNAKAALVPLKNLFAYYPDNANLSYLIGVCYCHINNKNDSAIYHLETATQNVDVAHEINSYKEFTAPVFVYYFLAIVYAKQQQCDFALAARKQFFSLYPKKNDYFVKDCMARTAVCDGGEYATNLNLKNDTSLVTKHVNYTTSSPLYGVQIGAFSKMVPVYHFKNVKDVEAFLDTKGIVRYVIGHYNIRKQAEKLLEKVQASGYPDAFIVDVNQEKRFENEVISLEGKSVKKENTHDNVIYSVQIGAFREAIPEYLAEKYLQLTNINETKKEDLTVLTSGNFKEYTEALDYKNQLLKMGIPGVFIVSRSAAKKQ